MAAHKPIRVLQLLGGLKVGGLEMVTASLVERLREEFDFRVVCYDEEGPLKDRFTDVGVRVELVPRKMGVDLKYPFKLARVLRREGIDVIHAHNNTALFYGVLAAILSGGRRVVFTAHDRAVPKCPTRLLQRLLGKATSAAVAVSEAGKQRLLAMDGFDPHRVLVVRNGADERAFATPLDPADCREKLGVPLDAEVIGTVARLYVEKNIPMMVRAFGRLAAQRPKARLVIAGDGPERALCEDTARSLGVLDRVHFLGTRLDVTLVLGALDVFALSSNTEGLPIAVLEAMASELPVVATDVGALSEVVRAGETGWLVPSGDDVALADKLNKVLSDLPAARELGRTGGIVFREGFTLERMASAYGRVYREAAEGAS